MNLIIDGRVVKISKSAILSLKTNRNYDASSNGYNESYKRAKNEFNIFQADDSSFVFHSNENGYCQTITSDSLNDFDFPLSVFKVPEFIQFAKQQGLDKLSKSYIVQDDSTKTLMRVVHTSDISIFSDMKCCLSSHHTVGSRTYSSYILKGCLDYTIVTNLDTDDINQYSTHVVPYGNMKAQDIVKSSDTKSNDELVKSLLEKGNIKYTLQAKPIFKEERHFYISKSHLNVAPTTYLTKPSESHLIALHIYGKIFHEFENDALKILWYNVPKSHGFGVVVIEKYYGELTTATSHIFTNGCIPFQQLKMGQFQYSFHYVQQGLMHIAEMLSISDLSKYIGLYIFDSPLGKSTSIHGFDVHGELKATLKISPSKTVQFWEQQNNLYSIIVDNIDESVMPFQLANTHEIINNLLVQGDENAKAAEIALALLIQHNLLK